MSIIKICGLSHITFGAPDLARMQAFLEDFGMTPVMGAASGGADLFMAGSGPEPFLHRTVLGPPAFIGLGLAARSMGDLGLLAAATGCAPEPFDAPGGGWAVTLHDPDGIRIEVVAGRSQRQASLAPEIDWNSVGDKRRRSQPKRQMSGASNVIGFGHCVLGVKNFRASERWYKDHFGLLTSDEIESRPGEAMGAFLRCDLGDEPADHHTLFLAQTGAGTHFRHAAFEVRDFDDLMAGHDHLETRGHTQAWGIGRHVLGSQVFDYWRDPWGHLLEHITDGDVFTRDDPPQLAPVETLPVVQWGQAFNNFQGKNNATDDV